MNFSHEALLGFLVTSLLYRLVRLRMAILKSRTSARGRVAARPIFWVMTMGYLFFVGSCVFEAFHLRSSLFWPLSFMGLGLYGMALVLREKAMNDLGRHFSTDIEIRDGHTVIRQGFYRYVRHPLLVCMAIEIMGVALVFNAYRTLWIGGVGMYFPLLVIRQRLEERHLLHTLGEPYRTYQHEVGAFWPRWHWHERTL